MPVIWGTYSCTVHVLRVSCQAGDSPCFLVEKRYGRLIPAFCCILFWERVLSRPLENAFAKASLRCSVFTAEHVDEATNPKVTRSNRVWRANFSRYDNGLQPYSRNPFLRFVTCRSYAGPESKTLFRTGFSRFSWVLQKATRSNKKGRVGYGPAFCE